MKLLIRVIATALGAGYSPVAPGTCGAIVACLLYWFGGDFNTMSLGLIIVIAFVLGLITSTKLEAEYIAHVGSEKGHDPQFIVIDEFVGMMIALVALPKSILITILSFVLFRFFDIVKPFPIKQSQKLPSGWGIMMDDILAGLCSNIIVQLCLVLKILI